MEFLSTILLPITFILVEHFVIEPIKQDPTRRKARAFLIFFILIWLIYLVISGVLPIKLYWQNIQAMFASQKHSIVVYGNDIEGVQWIVPENGTYLIQYRDGAYSGWPEDINTCPQQGCWKTAIYTYVGCVPEFERVTSNLVTYEQLTNPSLILGYKTPLSQDDAIRASKRQIGIKVELQKNQCLLFIADDGRDRTASWDAYSDNRGEVIVNIYLISTP